MPSLVKYSLLVIPADDGVGCNKNNEKTPYLLAIFLAVVLRRYNTKCIA
jgi:hypothetical protein